MNEKGGTEQCRIRGNKRKRINGQKGEFKNLNERK